MVITSKTIEAMKITQVTLDQKDPTHHFLSRGKGEELLQFLQREFIGETDVSFGVFSFKSLRHCSFIRLTFFQKT